MKISKRQLKRIIREEKRKLQESGDIYARPQHPMVTQGQKNKHLGLLSRAVEACLATGMTPDEICALCEEECAKQDIHRDGF
jgi:hypothetical protein